MTRSDVALAAMGEEGAEQPGRTTALGRLAAPREIAEVILFLASDRSGWRHRLYDAGVPSAPEAVAMSPTRNVPQVLVQIDECLSQVTADRSGALWRLAEAGRQLDANVVRLPAGEAVQEHVEPDLDVLLLVIEGAGWLGTGASRRPLAARSLVWLPRVAPRALSAGPDGLVYLTVHRRRPALTIKSASDVSARLPASDGHDGSGGSHASDGSGGSHASDGSDGSDASAGGEAPCLLDLVCPVCDRVSAEATARYCSRCGTALPSRTS